MISFKSVDNNTLEAVTEELSVGYSNETKKMIEEIIGSFEDSDLELAACVFADTLLIRIFDFGRYLFAFPYELTEDADLSAAIEAVREYAMREEIPLVFSDVPAQVLPLFSGFLHMDLDAEDKEGNSYRIKIKNECQLIDEIPNVILGRVTLNEICESDLPLYAKLARDKDVNKYWGYDYSEDEKDATDEYFLDNARCEFARGVACSMAIRVDGEFVGESIIYAFDGKGGAEFALRLLKNKQGYGLGTAAAKATLHAAREIGLCELRAIIMAENLPSIGMLKSIGASTVDEGERITFAVKL